MVMEVNGLGRFRDIYNACSDCVAEGKLEKLEILKHSKQGCIQPRSQGLSSFRPLRDFGNELG